MGASKIIVGTGLIAKSFDNTFFTRNTLLLASGVSNSQEIRKGEFEREMELVRDSIRCNPQHHVLYFSTCSINNGVDSPYIQHKSRMEQQVRTQAESFNIFRLPQIVGYVKNTTLVSTFVDAILDGEELVIQEYALRNLLGVADLSRIVASLVSQGKGINSVQNVASACNIPVADIVNETARLLERIPRIKFSPTGYGQEINIDFLRASLFEGDRVFANDYWRRVLMHYVPLYLRRDKSLSELSS